MKRGKPLARKGPGLKQTPLKQGKAGLKKSSLKSGDSPLARTPLRPRSVKRQTFMREERIPLIEQLVKAGVKCEIGPLLSSQGIPEARHCRSRIEGLHELRKRSAGGSLTNHDNLVPACNMCNGWVEDHPDLAWQMQLVIRPGDPDWDRLGTAQD